MNRLLPALMAGVALGMAGTRRGICIRADAARLLRWTALLRHLSLLLREGACTLP